MQKLFEDQENTFSSMHTGRPTADRLSTGDKQRPSVGFHLVAGGARTTDGV
jgi:hypothetical protein